MPVINKPNQHFDATTYTGNGTAGQSITNAGAFQPDLVWIKSRSLGTNHALYDSIRGAFVQLQSNSTDADGNYSPYGVTAFNSNGFSVSDLANGGYNVNGSTGSPTYVAWQWKATSANTTNTDGSITSIVRANQTAGFSVVTYTGSGSAATVGHGLGATPKMIIIKNRDNATYDWNVYHANLSSPTTLKLYLNTTSAETNGGNNAGTWNSSAPSSTVFSLGSFLNVNQSGNKFVAYCFAEVPGYSKFGTYTGDGSATNGPFVYLGFRPKCFIVKRIDTSGLQWEIFDSARFTYNGMNNPTLYPNAATAENSDAENYGDFLSNGFKLRYNNGNFNANGGTYIYAAFAEAPFKYANAR